jgi:hypothetical protein
VTGSGVMFRTYDCRAWASSMHSQGCPRSGMRGQDVRTRTFAGGIEESEGSSDRDQGKEPSAPLMPQF